MSKSDFFSEWEDELRSILAAAESKTQKSDPDASRLHPNMYNIYLINDPEIEVSFYLFILEEFFNLTDDELISSFNKLRRDSYVIYGLFTKEIAESKISYINDISESSGYQVKCVMCRDHGYVIKKP